MVTQKEIELNTSIHALSVYFNNNVVLQLEKQDRQRRDEIIQNLISYIQDTCNEEDVRASLIGLLNQIVICCNERADPEENVEEIREYITRRIKENEAYVAIFYKFARFYDQLDVSLQGKHWMPNKMTSWSDELRRLHYDMTQTKPPRRDIQNKI